MKFKSKIATVTFLSCLFLIISFKLTFCSELRVDSIYPPVGIIGQDLEVTIKGSGFDEDTRFLIYPSDLEKSAILDTFEAAKTIRDVITINDKIYVTDNSSTFYIINIEDPSNFNVVGSITIPNSNRIYLLDIVEHKVYLSDDSLLIHIIDISEPTSPTIVDSLVTPDVVRDIVFKDNIIYAADRENLHVININESSGASLVKSFDIKTSGFKEVKGYLYAYIGDTEYQIIDTSTPLEPKIVGFPQKLGYYFTVSGDVAYAVDGNENLLTINIQDPKNPSIINYIEIPKRYEDNDELRDFIINDNYVYVIRKSSGVIVIDVHNPEEPTIIHREQVVWPAIKGEIIDNILCVTNWFSGVTILDISNPGTPSIIKNIELSGGSADEVIRANQYAGVIEDGKLLLIEVPVEVMPNFLYDDKELVITLPAKTEPGTYSFRIINGTESYEVIDAVTFLENYPEIWISSNSDYLGVTEIGSQAFSKFFTVFNMSDKHIELESISVNGAHASEFGIQNNDCSQKVLSPSNQCNFQLSFMPASIGKKYAEISVSLSNSNEFIFDINLTGWGIKKGSYQYEDMWPILHQPWYFSYPGQLTIDDKGFLYLLDKSNARVIKLTSNGQIVTQWGKHGKNDGEFSIGYDLFFGNMVGLSDIAVDKMGYVYIADSRNKRIQKFDSEGNFITKWGGEDDIAFNFIRPQSVAIDHNNDVWVADPFQGIHKFSSNGIHIETWEDGQKDFPSQPHLIRISNNDIIHVISSNTEISRFTIDGTFLNNWRGPIFSDSPYFGIEGKLTGLAIDDRDNIFIAAPLAGYIVHYDLEGNEINKFKYFSGYNVSSSTCAAPDSGMIFNKKNQLFFTHEWNNNILKINKKGELLSIWGGLYDELAIQNGEPDRIAIHPDNTLLAVNKSIYPSIDRYTSDFDFITFIQLYVDNKLVHPQDITVDDGGDIYVLTYKSGGNHHIFKLDDKLNTIKYWEIGWEYYNGISVDKNGYIYAAAARWGIYKYSPDGELITTYNDPTIFWIYDVAVGDDGYIYALDGKNGIFKFTSDFKLIKKWGGEGSSEGLFYDADNITVDKFNRVFVADTGNNRVQIFTSEGDYIGIVGNGYGFLPGQLNKPIGVAVSLDGEYVYVTEKSNKRYNKFKFTNNSNNSKAIILAGQRSADDNLWNTTQMCANFAFRTLTFRGFTKETIQYLSPNVTLDLDGNGELDDVDGDATRDNLKSAITHWAKDAEELVLYLTDHGGDGSFRLSETETLDADDLDTWLDTLQETISGKVIVIYDACESGSFISRLTPPANKERIVITSTYPEEEAQFITQGTISFSNYFWTHIFNGLDVKEAFRLAESAMKEPREVQNPLIDSNGNGIGNEDEDFIMADNIYIGSGKVVQGEAPAIESVSEPQTIVNSTSATLEAFGVTDADEISRVWAVIRTPNYRQNVSLDPLQDLPSVDMIAGEDNRYEGIYDKFNTPGIYQIAVYARDLIGNTSIPLLTTVTVENPLKRRAIIVAGGDQNDAMWPAIEKSVKFAYEALSFQGYPDDNIYLLSPVSIPRVSKLPVQNILSNLEFALNTWTDENTQDVVLYIVGKGDDRVFYINQDEVLSSGQLGEWLNNLQTKISDIPVLIYDACRSESFFTEMTPPKADKKRILLASTGSNDPAYFLSEGNISFSQYFWNDILNGASVFDAYSSTKKALTDVCREQVPSLDDNGNGIGNDKQDGGLASRFVIGNGIIIGADEPIIGSVMPPHELDGEECVTLWAQDVTSTGTIGEVWAEILPPAQHPEICDVTATTVSLILVESNRYEKTVCGFSSPGVYEISVYAMDTDENISMPKKATVKQLSGLMKGDIDGDGDVDLQDAVIALKVLTKTETSTLIRSDYVVAGVDVNENNMIGLEELIYILRKVSGI